MRKNKFNKKINLILIIALVLTLFVFPVIQGYLHLESDVEDHQDNLIDLISQRTSSILSLINSVPGGIAKDILFVKELACIENLFDLSEDSNYNSIKDFNEFIRRNSIYNEICIIDLSEKNVLVLDSDNVEMESCLGTEVFDFSNEFSVLEGDEIYMSNLIKYNNESFIFYISPINKDDEKVGYLVAQVDVNYFLDDIRRFQREGEEVFLIEKEGYYLANPNESKERSFLSREKCCNFYEDYPEITKEDLMDDKKVRLETDNFLLTRNFIYPTTTSFELYQGYKKLSYNDSSSEENVWILVSVSDKESLNNIEKSFQKNYFLSIFFLAIIFLGIVILLIYSWRGK